MTRRAISTLVVALLPTTTFGLLASALTERALSSCASVGATLQWIEGRDAYFVRKICILNSDCQYHIISLSHSIASN